MLDFPVQIIQVCYLDILEKLLIKHPLKSTINALKVVIYVDTRPILMYEAF